MGRNQKIKAPPEELVTYKNWYEIRVDGRSLGVLWPSRQTEEEVNRLKGLMGIDIVPASNEKLIEINARTSIPARLFNRWERAFKEFIKRQPGSMQ